MCRSKQIDLHLQLFTFLIVHTPQSFYIRNHAVDSWIWLCRGLGVWLNCMLLFSMVAAFLGVLNGFVRGCIFLGSGGVLLCAVRSLKLTGSKKSLFAFAVFPCLLVLYPPMGEYFRGNWDPNVYLNTASSMAQTGSGLPVNDLAESLPPHSGSDLYSVDRGDQIKFPGFYVLQQKSQRLEPQFYPAYSVFLSWGFHLGGWRYANILLMTFSAVLMGLLAYQLSGRNWMACGISMLALMFNPVQIWFAGFPSAEILLQTQVLLFLLSWLHWFRSEDKPSAVLAGFFCGICLFTSVTALLFVSLVALFHGFITRKENRGIWFFASWIFLLPLHVIQVRVFNWTYFQSVMDFVPYVLGKMNMPILLLAALTFGLGLFLPMMVLIQDIKKSSVFRMCLVMSVTGIFLIGMTGWVFFSDTSESPLHPLILMVSRTGFMFSMFGLMVLLGSLPKPARIIVFIPVLLCIFFIVYPLMVQVFPWAYKRHLAFTLPVLSIGLGIFWSQWAAWLRLTLRGQVLLFVLALLFLFRPLYRGRDFAFERDWRGLETALETLIRDVPKDAILLTTKYWGASLDFHFDRAVHPVIPSDTLSPALGHAIHDWMKQGRELYMIRNDADSFPAAFETQAVSESRVSTRELAQTQEPFGVEIKHREFRLVSERLLSIEGVSEDVR